MQTNSHNRSLKAAASPPVAPPPEYHLLHRARVVRNDLEIPYVRLSKIERPAAPMTAEAAQPTARETAR